MATVLVVEDEPPVQRILKRHLGQWGHNVFIVQSLLEAKELISREKTINLVLLDRALKDGDGLKFCRALKSELATRSIPIVVLTGLTAFEEELQCYHAGADIYLPKPFEASRLKRYCEAFLNRSPYQGERPLIIQFGRLELDSGDRSVRLGERLLTTLPPRLFELLSCLVARLGRVISRRSLAHKIWKNRANDKQVAIAISRLRAYLGRKYEGLIRTTGGIGYSINPDFCRESISDDEGQQTARPALPHDKRTCRASSPAHTTHLNTPSLRTIESTADAPGDVPANSL